MNPQPSSTAHFCWDSSTLRGCSREPPKRILIRLTISNIPDENRLKITLAVAGFKGDDLSVNVEDNRLSSVAA